MRLQPDDHPFSDATADAVLSGQDAGDAPAGLTELVSALRDDAATTRPVAAGPALAEFVGGAGSGAVIALDSRRRLRRGVAAIAATTTGKVLLGAAAAAATLGGAHAVDLVDLPGLPEGERPSIVELDDTADDTPVTHGSDVSGFVHETDLEGCEKGRAVSDLASSNATDHRNDPERDRAPCTSDGTDATDAEGGDEAIDTGTHGSDVSGFVHETDLEGCEKGRAVSDLASSNATDHRNDPERDRDPCTGPDDPAKPTDPGNQGQGNQNPAKPTDPGNQANNQGKP